MKKHSGFFWFFLVFFGCLAAWVWYKYREVTGTTTVSGFTGSSASAVADAVNNAVSNQTNEAVSVPVSSVETVSSTSSAPVASSPNNGQTVVLAPDSSSAQLTDYASAGKDAVSGNYIGAAVSFLSGLLTGHSPWYKCDKAIQAGDWATAANYLVAFYNRGGINDADYAGGIANFTGFTGKRYLQVPLAYSKTNDVQLLPGWKALYAAGLVKQVPPNC